MKSKNGTLFTTVEEQLKRWREHFEEALNVQRERISVEEALDPPPDLGITDTHPSRDEIVSAIKKLKNGKAAGIDNITAEVLKADVEGTANILLPLFRDIWVKEQFPTDWKEGLIVKIPKKLDTSDCTSDLRGISLLR